MNLQITVSEQVYCITSAHGKSTWMLHFFRNSFFFVWVAFSSQICYNSDYTATERKAHMNHMKKITLSTIVLAGILLANVCIPAQQFSASPLLTAVSADTAAPSDFDYTVNHDGKGVTVTKYKGSAAVLAFPEKINGLPVTEIGDHAFYCNETLTEVTLPDSLTSIGAYAFSRCSNLLTVAIPKSVTDVGSMAFNGTAWWTALRDAGNTPMIINNVFVEAVGCIGTVTVPSGVTKIADMAFYCSDGIEKVILPDTVTEIGNEVFEECCDLTEINIPEHVTAIGANAFDHCIGLNSLTIPPSVVTIGEDAFNDCFRLTVSGYTNSYAEEYLKENNVPFESIGTVAPVTTAETTTEPTVTTTTPTETIPYASPADFKYQVNAAGTGVSITKYTGSADTLWIPPEIEGLPVVSINPYAFHNCGSLIDVHIPDGVITIGANAFDGCTAIKKISIPASVTEIGSSAFYTGGGLTIIGEPDSYAEAYAKQKSMPFLSVNAVPGDLNNDNAVNLKDAVLLRRYIAGGWNVKIVEAAADINKDGTVNLKDVVLLRRFIAGGWGVTL